MAKKKGSTTAKKAGSPKAVKRASKKSSPEKAKPLKAAKASTKRKAVPTGPKAKAKQATPTLPKPISTPPTSKAPTEQEISLGRPLVTQEEKLYMLFHDDYLARQVFEFLRVETIKELEHFSQQQIIHMMTKPLRMTVDRIRQRLAQYKRSLKDDEQFAADYLKQNR